MKHMARREMETPHDELVAGVTVLVAKYRAVVQWDFPEMDEVLAGKLIMKALRKALKCVEKALPA